jgi:Na+/H+ antiporter NhaC
MSPTPPPLWPDAVGLGGPLALLPVVLAVGAALWSRQVLLSLFLGLFSGTLLLTGLHPWKALLSVADPFALNALSDRSHVKVVLFSLFIAATVAVVGRSGATEALVARLAARAKTRRSGMLAAWAAGLVVFFDDYANCLVVGSSMRPLTDRLGISREKLAYIVDSTAAPVATIALVSTWVGFEVGLIDEALQRVKPGMNAYSFFMEGLGWRSYPIFAVALTGLVALTGRDFGPMVEAEALAANNPVPAREDTSSKGNLWLAVVPIGALVGVTGWSLWAQGTAKVGMDAALFEIIGGADGYDAMLHGSVAALALALGLTLSFRAMRANEAIEAALGGVRELIEPLIVLVLAWSLSTVVGDLHAADYLVGLLGGSLPGWSLPTIVFLIGAALSFATGTSFGTMGVLIPLVIPLVFQVDPSVAVPTTAAVLAGAVWGDHCSPISDTTILSSTGSGCELGAHTRTQLPYALLGGGISILFGSLPAGLGLPAWPGLVLGILAMWAFLRFRGKLPMLQA